MTAKPKVHWKLKKVTEKVMESPGIWEAQKSTNPVYALSKIF